MRAMTLADELVLLDYDGSGTAWAASSGLDYGLAGALLMDLYLAARIDVVGNRVAVLDATPTGETLADAALGRISESPKARKPEYWAFHLAYGARRAVLDRLVEDGALRREPGRVLGLFPHTRYPPVGDVEPLARTEARERIRSAVLGDNPVDSRTAALCGLVSAMMWERRIVPELPRRRSRARLRAIRHGAWIADAVEMANG